MRTHTHFNHNSAAVLMSGLGALIVAVNFAHAQPIQPEILFSFTNGPAYPVGALIQGNDGSFYGTTAGGGRFGAGAVFRVTTNGVLTTLASFNDTDGSAPNGLTLGSDGNFYGTTSGYVLGGGYANGGTVFRVTTNGVLTTLVAFADTNGDNPSGLTLGNDGNFYGTTALGGSFLYYGTVFKVTTNGVLTTLASFNGTNGAYPEAGLTLGSDGSFYGTTFYGGDGWNANLGGGNGTVFQVTTNGVLTTLVSFAGTTGYYPEAGLTLGNDGNFYGTTLASASFGEYGTVFKVTTNGVLTTLVWFDPSSESHNSGGLTLGNDGNFYGTISGIDPYSYPYPTTNGKFFRVTTNGDLTILVSFNGTNGANPYNVGLTLGSDGNLYGTTSQGGSAGRGTVFRVTTNGILTTLLGLDSSSGTYHSGSLTLGNDSNFYGTISGIDPYGYPTTDGTVFRVTTNGDLTTLVSFNGTNGANPYNVGLTLDSDGNLYGTTAGGGITNTGNPYGHGTVFQVTTNGVLTTLISFAGINGRYPKAGLTFGNDGNLYGTTSQGGAYSDQFGSSGTVFRVTTNGVLTRLVSFAGTNGAWPGAALTLGNDGNLYGTTAGGGITNSGNPYGYGTVFQVTTNGALTTLISFAGINGRYPNASLTLGKDGNLYGTTAGGGITNSGNPYGYGTAFQVTTNGVVTTLVSFAKTNGAYPQAGLTLGNDGNFYGSTFYGGSFDAGTVFQVTTNGVLTTLLSFDVMDAGHPYAGLTLGSDGNFYGTTEEGGTGGLGVIYRLRHGAYLQSFATTSNGFRLNTLNVGGSGWVVLESSSDLMTWTPIQTNGTAAAQQFLDPAALTQTRRFYRVRQL